MAENSGLKKVRLLSLKQIHEAKKKIKNYIRVTPLEYCPYLSKMAEGSHVYIKCENLQCTGSFKVRGAFNKLYLPKESIPDIYSKGVVTASTGNHALACVIGCQPRSSKVTYESIKAGTIIFEESQETLSDATSGGIEENSVTFEHCQTFVDDWILVEEETITKAIFFMLSQHQMVIEGSAGVSLGAFIANAPRFAGQKSVILACGANISMMKLKDIINAAV